MGLQQQIVRLGRALQQQQSVGPVAPVPSDVGQGQHGNSGHENLAQPALLDQHIEHEHDDTLDTAIGASIDHERTVDQGSSMLTNPLAASPSTFLSASNGRTFYLGTSSNWSFTGRILHMTHEHLFQTPLPANSILFDGTAYDLGWGGTRMPSERSPAPPVMPSLDYAIYLLNAVKFRCGQIFHLFDEDDFKIRLHDFYAEPERRIEKAGLWYIQFLLILALGKALLYKSSGKRPAGVEFFARAMQLLPDVTSLCQDPVLSTEILCAIALYLQSVDYRNSADIVIGQAMRMAFGYGMHTDMPVHHLGEALVQRCRKVWWTVHILDRQITSLMGNPQSIRDEAIHCSLPVFSGSPHRTSALDIHIKLVRIIAYINNNIYGVNGRLNEKFLMSTKTALGDIAGLADQLKQVQPLQLDEPENGASRMSASLHLLYHQCIVLGIRPIIFCCLKIRYEAEVDLGHLITSQKVQSLLKICVESALQILNILENLQAQGLLVMPVIEDRFWDHRPSWFRRSIALIDEMVTAGNLVASHRKADMQLLNELVACLSPAESRTATCAEATSRDSTDHVPNRLHPSTQGSGVSEFLSQASESACPEISLPQQDVVGMNVFGDEFTAEQILALVDSLENQDAEWMARAMHEDTI
ncbi:hypothetical protein PFICI_14004 [Pestalotiopsis fici W106-1]|uniref:Xylanolytic transcriptional activator regulatory domain-containing protein n=1 Tax=Pestalotiopsis fici (strain W106-1 / CGMCC3.15140) TaxID=1229662 RepID=W3WJU3_PESFW|nr:uncharacterized protein PFICI_14004 [Pestalotiopsis fici W106-1]ETS74138.1 hypothetical protein PFICI_14004 [Pestalotiopsis fici W106-1]